MTVVGRDAPSLATLKNFRNADLKTSSPSATSRISFSVAFPASVKFFDFTSVHLSAAKEGTAQHRKRAATRIVRFMARHSIATPVLLPFLAMPKRKSPPQRKLTQAKHKRLSAAVKKGMAAAARRAHRVAREHGTPIYVWENGK